MGIDVYLQKSHIGKSKTHEWKLMELLIFPIMEIVPQTHHWVF